MTTFTAKTTEDILAAVPVVLGFHPEESVVMLTFGAPLPFHARLDLPPPEDDEAIATAVGLLLEPARRHGVAQVVLVVYAADAAGAVRCCEALEETFESAGIGVIDLLVADGRHWFSLGRGRGLVAGAPYDVLAHRFAVESVVAGMVTHGSREALAESIAVDPVAAARVAAMLGSPASAGDVIASVEHHVLAGTAPGDAELAGLLVSLADTSVRDAAWFLASRETAPAHLRLWCDVVRRSPRPLAPTPLVLLAVTAWMAGHGALAWCALDRLLELEPDHSLGNLVAMMLENAVPPTFLDDAREDYLRGAPEGP